MNKNNLINVIYKIVISTLSVILGAMMILFTFSIYFKGKSIIEYDDPLYQIYNVAIISKYLKLLLIPFILWVIAIVVSVILSYVYPYKEKEKNKQDVFISYELLKNKIPSNNLNSNDVLAIYNERRNRKIGFVIVSIISLLLTIFPARYLFTFSNFTASNISSKDEAIKMAVNVFPFVIGAFIICSGYIFYVTQSIKKEINMIQVFLKENKNLKIYENKLKENNYKYINIARICIGVISIVFIIIGICNGDVDSVLKKAINICTECIGLA